MNQIARCDWLPERARWSHLDRSGLPAVSRKQTSTKSHIINPLLTKFVRSRWLDFGLVLFLRVYGPRPISSHLDRTNLVNNPYALQERNNQKNYILNFVLPANRRVFCMGVSSDSVPFWLARCKSPSLPPFRVRSISFRDVSSRCALTVQVNNEAHEVQKNRM